MNDKNYTKYLEALREYRRMGKIWRATYDLRTECEETLKNLRKFEDKTLHRWNKAGDKLTRARNKFEGGIEDE